MFCYDYVQHLVCQEPNAGRIWNVTLSMHSLSDWRQARRVIEPYEIQDREVKWTNPEVGMYKCNVDVAF